jgi:uncharacterized protein (TIGR03437 family)
LPGSGPARGFLLFLAAVAASAHAPPTPVPAPPFRVQTNRLVDAKGDAFLLRGAVLPLFDGTAIPPVTLRVLRQRWNFNAVRIPVSIARWRRDGQPYLDGISAAVAAANRESLVAVVAAVGETPLPDAAAVEFWRAAAPQLRSTPSVILSLYNEPRAAAWPAWAAAMQPLVDAIRAAGAAQLIAAAAADFQGFGRESYLRDANVLYEIGASAATDEARDRSFGFLVNDVPVFAGTWGGACASLTADSVLEALSYFDRRNMSWTVATGACRAIDDNALLWMTGDPGGFGTIDPTQIAGAAGGFPGPVAPGEIISLYGQGIGPETAVGPRLVSGRVDTTLGEVRVLFDGIPGPILLAGYFQVNVQVPYEVAGRARTSVQLVYRDVPSNTVELAVAAAAPGIFTTFAGGSDALALNQDGTVNGPSTPALRGSIVALFATGAGQTDPPSVTGVPAAAASNGLRVSAAIAGRAAEVLYAGPAPTLVGVAQINVRVPADLPEGTQRAAVLVTVGGASSRSGVILWVR